MLSRKTQFMLDELRIVDGRLLGEALVEDEWAVREVFEPVFATTTAGLPLYKLVYNELARGQIKTTGGAGMALAETVLEPGTDVIIAAGDVDQAAIMLEALDGFVDRSDTLRQLVKRRGNERIVEGGSRIRVISSDVPSAYGLGGTHRRFRLICDELVTWRDERLFEALIGSTGKVADVQSIVLSNAGFGEGQSWQWRVRESARVEEWGRLFAPKGVIASWITPEWLAQMNVLLPPSAYARVILNEWTTGSGDFVSPEQWARCVDEDLYAQTRGEQGVRYYGGLDLGLTKDRTALAICHHSAGQVTLDELMVWQGSRSEPVSITAIEQAVIDAADRYPSLHVLADPWQLKGSLERLRGKVSVDEFVFSPQSVQRLSTTLYQSISAARLRTYPDAELEREVTSLLVVEREGGWRMDHRAGGYSDRAVALAMALHAAGEGSGSGQSRAYPLRQRIPTPSGMTPMVAAR
jgi:hypothetical protein